MKIKDLAGQKFNRLTIMSFAERKNDRTYWWCKCDCGKIVKTHGYSVQKGQIKSCGCWAKDFPSQRTHGLSSHKIYPVWRSMRDRCSKPKCKRYPDYGGRGIKFSERWNKFENFVEDMFDSYEVGLTLERKDVNGNYEKDNCVWATRKEQGRNTRTNHVVEYKDFKGPIAELAERIGMKAATLHRRISAQKWSVVEAVEKPINESKKNTRYKKGLTLSHG